MVTDLRTFKKSIQPMDPLQSGIPLSSLLPKGWPLIVTDLKDCFFSISLKKRTEKNLPSQCLLIITLNLLKHTSGLPSNRKFSIAPPGANSL